jgi:hypothetical protein
VAGTFEPEGKRPLGRPGRRWEDNIKMDLHAVGCGDMDWIELAQDRDRWRAFWNLMERDHLGDPGVDGRIILGWIFRTLERVVGTGWSWL